MCDPEREQEGVVSVCAVCVIRLVRLVGSV